MTKKKAVHKCKGPDEAVQTELAEAMGNAITEQTAEAVAAAMPKEAEVSKKEKKQRPVRCIQQYTDVEFRREYREVFDKLIEKSKAGGIQETRLLLKIGKFDDVKAAKRRGQKSLSEMLLDELKRRQDEREALADSTKAEQIATAKNANSGGVTGGSDVENG